MEIDFKEIYLLPISVSGCNNKNCIELKKIIMPQL